MKPKSVVCDVITHTREMSLEDFRKLHDARLRVMEMTKKVNKAQDGLRKFIPGYYDKTIEDGAKEIKALYDETIKASVEEERQISLSRDRPAQHTAPIYLENSSQARE